VKLPSILKRLVHDVRPEVPPAINLIARVGRPKDLAPCYALYRALRLPSAKASLRVLTELCGLLRGAAMQLFLVEDRACPSSSRIVSFGATVFVTDEFCCKARSALPPYLGMQIVRSFLSHDSPILSQEQVARGNAGDGLNVVMCFDCHNYSGLSREQILTAFEKHNEAFHLVHSGYHVKEFLAEPIGEEATQRMFDAGARLRRSYSRYFQKHHLAVPDSSQRPCLVGLTKREAFAKCGCHLSRLFAHSPPRFHFSCSEQALLRHALMGETCEDLARSLCVSPWTVKKRWHAIYERVVDVDRELLPRPVAHGVNVTSRGAERRRRLLYYLRQHFEELRPMS
jgi:hypothetical protein